MRQARCNNSSGRTSRTRGLLAVWSEATVLLNRFIDSEPGLRGELSASGAWMPLLEALLWSGLERSDKNKDNLF